VLPYFDFDLRNKQQQIEVALFRSKNTASLIDMKNKIKTISEKRKDI
jgi:hypothetical protein